MSFLPFQVLSFTKLNCCDFIASDEWLPVPVHPTTGLSCLFGGNAGVLSQTATKPKTFLSLKMHFSLFGLLYWRKPNWQRYERLLQVAAGMCVSRWWIFWTYSVIIHITNANNCLVKCRLMWFVSFLKICEFHSKVKWSVKIWGFSLVKVIQIIKIFR